MKIINCWQATISFEKYGVEAGDIMVVDKHKGKRRLRKPIKFQFYFYADDTKEARTKLDDLKITYEESGDYLKVYKEKIQYKSTDFKDFILDLHKEGIQTYEADLGPAKRWMIDNNIEIEDFDNIDLWYMDIETDDSSGKPIQYKKKGNKEVVDPIDPVLSVAFVDRKGTAKFFYNQASDKNDKTKLLEGEKKLLWEVKKFIDGNVDMVVGWNSSGFDMEFLRGRMKIHKVSMFYFWHILHEDMMKRTKYFYMKDPEARQQIKSYSLDFISNHFLGEGKIKHKEKIFEMYRDNFQKFKEYNIQDCQLLRRLEDQLGMIRLTYQMFQICGMPAQDWAMIKNIDTFMLRASNKKGTRHQTGEAFLKGWMPDGDDEAAYLGAFVIDPIPGKYHNVYDLDFKSLYPNIIRTFNISPDTYLGEGAKKNAIVTPGVVLDDKMRGQASYKKGPGIIPEEITKLLDEREKIRTKQKAAKDPLEWRDLNVKQLVVKELANSIYGAIGNRGFRGSSMNMAESITGTGQHLITHLSQWVTKEKDCKVIYGDTDSLFITIPEGEKIENIIDGINDHLEEYLQKFHINECTIKIQLDKKYDNFFIEAKKKYAGSIGGKISYVGLECIKRDTIPIAAEFQRNIIDHIFEDIPTAELHSIVREERRRILEDQIEPDSLVIHKSMSKDAHLYHGKERGYTPPVQVRVALAMKEIQGDKTDLTKAGSIISFIVTKDADLYAKPKQPLQAVHISEFEGIWDRDYYWNNVVYPPSCRLLESAYPEIEWQKFYITRHSPTVKRKAEKNGIILSPEITEPLI